MIKYEQMGIKIKKRLTPKQKVIVGEVVKQIKTKGKTNLAEIGRKAFNTKSNNAATVMTSRVLKNDNVQDAIEKMLESAGLGIDPILNELATIAKAEPRYITGDVKLRSLVELLKLHNAYPGKKTVKTTTSYKERIKDYAHKEIEGEVKTVSTKVQEIEKEV